MEENQIKKLETYLSGLERLGMKPGLERIKALLELCNKPQESLTGIHVAGTNGKGSVCAIVESVLRSAGYRTGLYTSPHLVSYRERFRICGKMIDERVLADLADELIQKSERLAGAADSRDAAEGTEPTYFEFTTALALTCFARQDLDYVVAETGLGGRLDATNVIEAPVAAITTVGFDHQAQLGNQLSSIAAEKAGIIKEGAFVACGRMEDSAVEVIERVCRAKRATLLRIGNDIIWSVLRQTPEGSTVCFKTPSGSYESIVLPLAGSYQIENCAVALGVVEGLRKRGAHISEDALRNGIATVRWSGRMDIICRDPLIVVDCAHNVGGARAVAATVGELFAGRRLALVLGMLRDKDIGGICDALLPLASAVFAIRVSSPRSLDAEVVADTCRERTSSDVSVASSLRKALLLARGLVEQKRADGILISGSSYLVGEAMRLLNVEVVKD